MFRIATMYDMGTRIHINILVLSMFLDMSTTQSAGYVGVYRATHRSLLNAGFPPASEILLQLFMCWEKKEKKKGILAPSRKSSKAHSTALFPSRRKDPKAQRSIYHISCVNLINYF